ncbi:hypothetical protein HPHPH44_0054 [Helicobacter pylori Hp H-44]|nr:hypothetical protein HPHPH44_0054 [Helicobacter pylori Hp H-44]
MRGEEWHKIPPPIRKIVAIKKSKTMKRLTKNHFLKNIK